MKYSRTFAEDGERKKKKSRFTEHLYTLSAERCRELAWRLAGLLANSQLVTRGASDGAVSADVKGELASQRTRDESIRRCEGQL